MGCPRATFAWPRSLPGMRSALEPLPDVDGSHGWSWASQRCWSGTRPRARRRGWWRRTRSTRGAGRRSRTRRGTATRGRSTGRRGRRRGGTGAPVFDGTSSSVTVADGASLRLTTGMTLEAWVYPTGALTGWRAVIDKNVDGYYLMASSDQGNRPAVGGAWPPGARITRGPTGAGADTGKHLAGPGGGGAGGPCVDSQGAGCTSVAAIATAGGPTYSDTGLGANTTYTYRVRATDAAGNLSAYSNVASTTTPAAADTQAPTAPGNLTATAGSGQINLSWTASTDHRR